MAECAVRRQTLEVGAECPNWARSDLCGGRSAMTVPTANCPRTLIAAPHTGKSRYQVRLPLPQEVGDAIVAYLECRPSISPSDHVFLRTIAPCRPFKRGDGISSLVRRVMKRVGIDTPFKGAHALRHTAATEMLRHGVPLEKIALVLRHRGIDTTAYYAKADLALLKQIAQPWQGAR